jgi:hypothetical protein
MQKYKVAPLAPDSPVVGSCEHVNDLSSSKENKKFWEELFAYFP